MALARNVLRDAPLARKDDHVQRSGHNVDIYELYSGDVSIVRKIKGLFIKLVNDKLAKVSRTYRTKMII